jgi:N-acetylglutamate synthase-like GNAT family acetyltransferase
MIIVKPFSPKHLGGALSVILPIQQEEFSIPITIDEQSDLLDIPGFYQTGKGNFWAAVADDKVVGTVALLDIGNDTAALPKMFVKADFRGQRRGVASSLLNALLSWSATKNIASIFLGTTEKLHAAHRFYQKNGFIEIPKSALPEKFPVMNVDTKVFKRALAAGRTP